MTTATRDHTCANHGAFGRYDPTCIRCVELAGQHAKDTIVTVALPRATLPAEVRDIDFQNAETLRDPDTGTVIHTGAIKKVNPVTKAVQYIYKDETYEGCLGWWKPRFDGGGALIGREQWYTLFPTVAERDQARPQVLAYQEKFTEAMKRQTAQSLEGGWHQQGATALYSGDRTVTPAWGQGDLVLHQGGAPNPQGDPYSRGTPIPPGAIG